MSIWRCRYLCRRTKIRIFRSLDLKRRFDDFDNECLRRIMGYRWFDFVSNRRLLRETDSRPIICTVRERQLRLYGHVARYSKVTLLTGLYRYETIWCGGGQGGAHNSHGWSKLTNPARSYLGWEGGLHGDLPGGTLGFSVVGWATQRAPGVCSL